MAKNQKTQRTQIQNLAITEQEITGLEMKQVRGGAAEKQGGTVVVDPKTGNKFEYKTLPTDSPSLPKMDVTEPPLQITDIKKK